MKILIVDDEADIGYILGFELKNLGHEVYIFQCAMEAQKHLKNEIPDAILCDFQMPKMNGLQLFLWLKDQGHRIPFYILSGEPIIDAEELKKHGVEEILLKPQDLLRLPILFK